VAAEDLADLRVHVVAVQAADLEVAPEVSVRLKVHLRDISGLFTE
jgi:hypothetical protein